MAGTILNPSDVGVLPPHHICAYDGKLVLMDYVPEHMKKSEYNLAAMRIIDNGFNGYVITPKGQVFEVLQKSPRKSFKLSPEKGREVLASLGLSIV